MTNAGQFQPGDGDHLLRSKYARSGGADDTALIEPQRSRLIELRAELATSSGVIDALRERAARMVLICEWGESWLQDKSDREGGIAAFEAKMLQRFFTAQAEARRSLEALIKATGKGDGGINADDVLKAIRDDK
jgi:hypothetical protein